MKDMKEIIKEEIITYRFEQENGFIGDIGLIEKQSSFIADKLKQEGYDYIGTDDESRKRMHEKGYVLKNSLVVDEEKLRIVVLNTRYGQSHKVMAGEEWEYTSVIAKAIAEKSKELIKEKINENRK